ncbi:MAG: lytic transglycosylase domain-containing protein [Actinomycetota bacterium]|nr:lytic transglycosylase domain-containing protein [Actinomycetota bacterium]
MPKLLFILLKLRSVGDVFKYVGYALFAVLLIVAMIVAGLSDIFAPKPPMPTQYEPVDAGTIPPAYEAAYRAAGEKYGIDWEVIAGIGYVETRHGTYRPEEENGCIIGPPNYTGERAMGPMQFLPSSWEIFGDDGNADGQKNPCDIRDAPFGTARHLKQAPGLEPIDYEKAVWAYNHSEAYVAQVLGAAYSYGWMTAAQSDDPSGNSWYRYQGDATSGYWAGVNCGPASVAMGIKRATGQHVPISQVRNVINDGGYTSLSQLTGALSNWGVRYRYTIGHNLQSDISGALSRGSAVLALVEVDPILGGVDMDSPYSPAFQYHGRYYSGSFGHWFVIKGMETVQGVKYYRVNDPLVFDGNGRYWYQNRAPKGRDRYYPVAQVHTAMYEFRSPQAVELVGPGSTSD